MPGAAEGDYVNALVAASCELVEMDEHGDQNQLWKEAPLSGLPETIALIGRKAHR